VAKVWGYCEGKGFRGRAVTLKIEFVDSRQITRSRTVAVPIELSDFEHLAAELLGSVFPERQLRFELYVSPRAGEKPATVSRGSARVWIDFVNDR